MNKLFENWNKFLNEGWEPKSHNKGTRDKEDVYIDRDRDNRSPGQKLRDKGEHPDQLKMPPDERYADWKKRSKYFEESENEYEPGRAVADIDTGEDHMSPEEIRDEEVQDLADKFNVEAFVEIASDGKPSIIVKHQDGKVSMYNDTEEMYKELADETGQDIHGSHDWYGDESPYDAGY